MTQFLELMGAWFVIMIIPGQDMALILRTTITHGRLAAFKLIGGICVALAIHLAVASSSLGFLIIHSPKVFFWIQKIGAAYIGYLGVTFLIAAFKMQTEENQESTNTAPVGSDFKLVKMGFLSTILNPKVLVFFFSIFSGFMKNEHSLINTLTYSLGILAQTLVFYWFFTGFVASDAASSFLKRQKRNTEAFSGAVLLLLAIKLLL